MEIDLEKIKYISVVDLELTCTESGTDRDQSEIIEIGIVLLKLDTLEEVKRITKVVRPIKNPILTDYCKNLTHISQEEVDFAGEYVTVMEEVVKELPPTSEFVWCAWGSDPIWIQKELKEKGSTLEFFPKYIDLKIKDGKRRGLKKALKANKIEQTLPAHRALSDAISTADLARKYKISLDDISISNKRTLKQQITAKQEEAINKLSIKCGVSLAAAKYILVGFDWEYSKCKHCIELIKGEI